MTSVTNSEQFDYLVDWMSKHLDVAVGLPREQCKGEIKVALVELAEELNALGPPHKRLYQWRRVWTALRYLIKTKLRQNFFCGRNHKFSKRQLRVIEFLNLEKVVREEHMNKNNLKSTPRVSRENVKEKPNFDDDFNWDETENASSVEDFFDDIDLTNVNENDLDKSDDFSEKLQSDDMIENSSAAELSEILMTGEINELLHQQMQIQMEQLEQNKILLNTMGKIEHQFAVLSDTELNNEFLLYENNKHLEVLLYRSRRKENNIQKKQA